MIWGADELPLGTKVSVAGIICFVDITHAERTNRPSNALVDIFKGDVLLPVLCDLRQLGLPKQQLRAIRRSKTVHRKMVVISDDLEAAKARGEGPEHPYVVLLTVPIIGTPVPTIVVDAPQFSPYQGHRVFQVAPEYRGRVALEDLA